MKRFAMIALVLLVTSSAIAQDQKPDTVHALLIGRGTTDTGSWQEVLRGYGVKCRLVSKADLTQEDFAGMSLIIVGANTAGRSQDKEVPWYKYWGDRELIELIDESRLPVLGISFAGLSLFGQMDLPVGGGHFGHMDGQTFLMTEHSGRYLQEPFEVGAADEIELSTSKQSIDGYYQPPRYVESILKNPGSSYHTVVRYKNYVVWGAGQDAAQLTESGRRLFANIVHDLAHSPTPDVEPLAKVSGRLLDPAGSGVPGALVHVERYLPGEEDGNSRQEAYTLDSRSRSDGSFVLSNLEPGAYRLEARHNDFEPLVEVLELGDGETHDLVLSLRQLPVEVRGQIVDESGVGLAEASLSFYQDKWVRVAVADDGEFVFRVARPGRYTLWASHESLVRRKVEVEITGLGDEVVIELARGANVSGRLLGFDPEDLARVRVSGSSKDHLRVNGVVTPDGRYRLSSIPAGDWSLVATHGHSVRATGTVTVGGPGEDKTLDLELEPGHRLSGVLLLDGQPLAAELVLRCRRDRHNPLAGGTYRARARSDGSFRFDGVSAHRCSLEIDGGGALKGHVEEVEASGDQELVVELKSTSLSGRVVESGSLEGVAGATVDFSYLGRRVESVTTDESGCFTFPALLEGKVAELRVTAEGYAFAEKRIELRSGIDEEQLVLTPTEPVVLQVLTTEGVVPRRVHVQPQLLEGYEYDDAGRTFRPDPDGRIVIQDLGAGRWMLRVSSEGTAEGPSALVEVEVPGGPQQVILKRPKPPESASR